MNTSLVLAIVLLVASVFLIIAILMQQGKNDRLSGSIAGNADTYYGKTKGRTKDKVLSRITTVVSILFILVVVGVYVMQKDDNKTTTDEGVGTKYDSVLDVESTAEDETTAATTATDSTADTTAAQTENDTSAAE